MTTLIQRKYSGFSLMETLFVIIVISIIAAIASNFAAGQATEVKVKAAATHIRHWQTAGMTFETQHDRWPHDSSELMARYPNTLSAHNPWLSPYQTETVGEHNLHFAVVTTLPDAQTAKRLASLLANSEIRDDTTLVVYGPTAAARPQQQSIKVKAIKTVEGHNSLIGAWNYIAADGPFGDSRVFRDTWSEVDEAKLRSRRGKMLIPVPHCPRGSKPEFQLTLSGFQKGCNQIFNLADPFSDDYFKWSCTPSTNWVMPIRTSTTRSVAPLQVNRTPVNTPEGKAWEVWVRTQGVAHSVEGGFGALQRDIPNYAGRLTYVTYCRTEGTS